VCGTVAVPGARFCHNCGAALPAAASLPAAERRIVTVLFGDLSDFTSWSEDLDPERVGAVTDRVLAALAGAGVGGAVGGVVGALVGMGIPEYEAKRYEGRIKSGGILLSVHCDNSEWTKKAKELLEQTGAEDVSSTGESAADFSKSDRPMPRADRKIS